MASIEMNRATPGAAPANRALGPTPEARLADRRRHHGTAGQAFYRAGERLDSLRRRKAACIHPQRPDAGLLAAICKRLMHTDYLDVARVSISVQGGDVKLGGSVPQRFMKYAIEDVIDGCQGVGHIENGIRVSGAGE